VSTGPPEGDRHGGFDILLGWGVGGIAALGGDVAVFVLVDVLRFTTAVDVATSAGAAVHPSPWPLHRTVPTREQLDPEPFEVADGSGPRNLSLSPRSLRGLGPGDRVVLPSANGSPCALAAAAFGVPVVAASLRNAAAVAQWVESSCARGPIGVIACGELRPDGSLRTAVEDRIGVGAVVAELSGVRSPEARGAAAVYRYASAHLGVVLAESPSGRELRGRGLAEDLGWAAAADVSRCVPVLEEDGAFRRS
jgi:2-phosphosulfolactate phosphatase